MLNKNSKILFQYVLGIADDHLILSQNLTALCGKGPSLEEDIAISNIALDLLGQSRELYTYAGTLEGKNRSEDDLVFFRTQEQFYNIQLVEQPNFDFAYVIVRQLFFAAFFNPYWRALSACNIDFLKGFSRKAEKETAYHLQHSSEWFLRLAGGTDESRQRLTTAIDYLHPYVQEFLSNDEDFSELISASNLPNVQNVYDSFHEYIVHLFQTAELSLPKTKTLHCHGRKGRHTEYLGHLLSDLQYMQRAYPGCEW